MLWISISYISLYASCLDQSKWSMVTQRHFQREWEIKSLPWALFKYFMILFIDFFVSLICLQYLSDNFFICFNIFYLWICALFFIFLKNVLKLLKLVLLSTRWLVETNYEKSFHMYNFCQNRGGKLEIKFML